MIKEKTFASDYRASVSPQISLNFISTDHVVWHLPDSTLALTCGLCSHAF